MNNLQEYFHIYITEFNTKNNKVYHHEFEEIEYHQALRYVNKYKTKRGYIITKVEIVRSVRMF